VELSSVDEKPSIQALERTQGYLKLPDGRAMTTRGTEPRRFAALDVGTGQVVGNTTSEGGVSNSWIS
jgi:hypothetical protein